MSVARIGPKMDADPLRDLVRADPDPISHSPQDSVHIAHHLPTQDDFTVVGPLEKLEQGAVNTLPQDSLTHAATTSTLICSGSSPPLLFVDMTSPPSALCRASIETADGQSRDGNRCETPRGGHPYRTGKWKEPPLAGFRSRSDTTSNPVASSRLRIRTRSSEPTVRATWSLRGSALIPPKRPSPETSEWCTRKDNHTSARVLGATSQKRRQSGTRTRIYILKREGMKIFRRPVEKVQESPIYWMDPNKAYDNDSLLFFGI